MRSLSFSAVLLVLGAETAAAQVAWTRDAGEGYLGLKLAHQASDRYFGADFQARPIASTYRQTSLGLYAELGLVDRWLTASLEGELFRRNSLDEQGATQGFGDLRVGLWSGLVVAPFRLSAGLRVGLPTGDPTPRSGLDSDAQLIANVLPTGDGELDLEPALALGYAFGGGRSPWPLQHYLVVTAGYWLRFSGISDAFSYRVELGTRIPLPVLDRLWWSVRVAGVESFASADDIANVAGNLGGLGQGVSFTSLGLELQAELWRGLGLSLGFDTAFRARRIIAAAPLRVGLSWDF